MAVPRVDRETFLQHLRQSRLLPKGKFRAATDKHRHLDNGQALARALVADGTLTRFQAKMLLAGRTGGFFLGRFRILGLLGKGGMGRVYKAVHQTMGRTVALKVLSPSLMSSERARALFLREVQATGALSHPNLVTAYDAGEAGGRHYLAMEYIDGPNLRQLVRRVGQLPIGLACEIVRQVALGLQHAHEKGMLHRDIKPANVLVRTTGPKCEVKILDFGLARLQQAEEVGEGSDTIVTGKRVVMGTPDYVSPEQARNLHDVDIRADLYSLGCTFYYLLTGHAPFPGGTALDKLIRHNTEAPAYIESLRHDVPMAVADIVHDLLAKNPDERFQTPQELADELAPFADAGMLHVARKSKGLGNQEPEIPTAASTQYDTAHGKATTAFDDMPGVPAVRSVKARGVLLWSLVAAGLASAGAAVAAWLHLD